MAFYNMLVWIKNSNWGSVANGNFMLCFIKFVYRDIYGIFVAASTSLGVINLEDYK